MKNCPHCQFLVSDEAATCSVCHRDLTAAPVPATVGAPLQASAAPWAPAAPGSPTPQGVAAPPVWGTAAGAPAPPPSAPGRSTTRVVLIACAAAVLGIVGLAVVAMGVVTVLGTTSETSSEDLVWQDYREPDGRFGAELPGEPVRDTVEMPASFGVPSDLQVFQVLATDFIASISITDGAIADGMTFAELPFSEDGAERAVEANGFMDAQIIDRAVVEGSGDTQMGIELQGTVDGEPAVMLSRVVLVGPDVYEISVTGPSDQRDQLAEIHDRIAESFRAPAD